MSNSKHKILDKPTEASILLNKNIETQGYKVLYLRQNDSSILFRQIHATDIIVMEVIKGQTKKLISLLRTSEDVHTSMIPIILFDPNKIINDRYTLSNIDGVIRNMKDLENHLAPCGDIMQVTATFNTERVENKDLPLLNTLRFITSRRKFNSKLTAIVNEKSQIGYDYPIASLFFTKTNSVESVNILREAERKGYIRSNFVDNIHTCKHCSSAFHNIRETCPSCHSADLNSETAIHHFVCANIAPESEYLLPNGEMVCMQCNRMLRNIGVDYDKPSFIYRCNECQHQFQQPIMVSFCFSCKKQTDISELKKVKISNYTITDSGKDLTHNGPENKIKITPEEIQEGYIAFGNFKAILKNDIARARQKGQSINFLTIKYSPFQSIPPTFYKRLCAYVKENTVKETIVSQYRGNFYYIHHVNNDDTEYIKCCSEHIKLIHNFLAKENQSHLAIRAGLTHINRHHIDHFKL